ncbi:MAG: N-acetylmuramoyl-L-alanine amidase [Rickettsiales bacterium]|nr:N-acetylmuramoyl-L-alanine amidase [Rickettsiales bacterium]
MDIIQHPSENFDGRGDAPIDHLVLHYTGMKTGAEALERLCDPAAEVSSHYLVEEDGRIFQLVDEAERAWHAGIAFWDGKRAINAHSIGIEIVNPGHEFGYHAFPEEQMVSVIALCKDILSRHDIAPRAVVGHSDVAFRRKQDPGELFDWKRLAEEGIGLWHGEPKAKLDFHELQLGSAGEVVRQLQEEMVFFGYGMPVDGMYGVITEQAVIAFQRHFRQACIDGVWDGECAARLDKLVKMI